MVTNTSVNSGLTVTAPAGAVCGLYPGAPASMNYFTAINPENAILPTGITTNDGICAYTYANLEAGPYHCGVSMEGCYAVCQMIHYTAQAPVYLDMKPEKLAGNGYEAGYVMRCTQAFADSQMLSDQNAWRQEYADLFQTPQFLRMERQAGRHQQTTNEELADFITKLGKSCENMYIFSLGTSPKYGYDIPLVLFTRENIAGKTLEEAAQIIKENGKPTVQYTAQCHSTEPVSTEGALAMMCRLCGDYGNRVLDAVDIYIIPRINPDGAYDVMRHSPTTNEDMNRDYLYMHNAEIRMVVNAYNLFLPEVAIDGHEKRSYTLTAGEDLCTDMEAQVGAGSLNHPPIMTQTAMEMAMLALEKGRQLGLRTHFYSKLASAAGGSAGSSYFGTRNSLSFLVETPGQVAIGNYFMHRRVLGQYVLASTVINYTVKNARKIMDIVHATREEMRRTGAIYDENNVIVLEHKKGETGRWATPLIHVPTGKVMDPAHCIAYTEHITALHTRPRATAYILPRGLANEQEILQLAKNHAIGYYPLAAGSRVQMRQYKQIDEQIYLAEEQEICLENGAYVFPNTVQSTILNVIMEPDFNRASGRKMTLYSMGLIKADASGNLPLFRYCHDLSDGKVHTE